VSGLSEIKTEREALMVLSALPEIGPMTVKRLMTFFNEGIETIFAKKAEVLTAVLGVKKAGAILGWREHFDLEAHLENAASLGVRYLIEKDPEYPVLLKELPDAPLGLYVRGSVVVKQPAVAMVGTRHCTAYGRKVTEQLVRGLVRAGYTIVSGMALGIDAVAHRTALEAGGRTVAVLGNGVDRIYPPQHKALYQELIERGAIMSEFYLGRKADRQSFPQRNRIVSGMCDATVVVESAARGGSLITARFAMEQNRTVFAVPGRLDQAESRGCLDLIRDGATLVTGVEDILDELRFMGLDYRGGAEETFIDFSRPADELNGLNPEEQKIMALLKGGEILHGDQLCEQLLMPSSIVHATLMLLELKRLVSKRADGCYERRV